MHVTKENFPNILEALHAIDEDNGGFQAIRAPIIHVPTMYDRHLPDIEKAIASLSRTERAPNSPPLSPHVKPNPLLDCEFWTYCAGEQEEMQVICNRSLELQLGSVLLSDYFEYFFDTEDPHQRALRSRIESLDVSEKAEADALRLQLK